MVFRLEPIRQFLNLFDNLEYLLGKFRVGLKVFDDSQPQDLEQIGDRVGEPGQEGNRVRVVPGQKSQLELKKIKNESTRVALITSFNVSFEVNDAEDKRT